MATHLAKIDHANTTFLTPFAGPYVDGNLLPLPTEGTDAYTVHTYEGVPTQQGGATIHCPTTRRPTNVLTFGPYLGTNFYSLSGAWDANVALLPQFLHFNTILISTTITAPRTYTTPSASVLMTYLNTNTVMPLLGSAFWQFRMTSDGGTLTLAPGAGCTFRGNTTAPAITTGTGRTLGIRLTNTLPGTEAYELYIY